jgi:hypothetical protein
MKAILLSGLGLVLACMIVSPLLHEASHALVMDLFSKDYRLSITTYPCVYGSIQVLSPMEKYQYIILLSSGIIASLCAGALFIKRGRKKSSPICEMCGVGFLLNPAIAMFYANDMVTMLSFFGAGYLSIALGCSLMAFCLYEANLITKALSCL